MRVPTLLATLAVVSILAMCTRICSANSQQLVRFIPDNKDPEKFVVEVDPSGLALLDAVRQHPVYVVGIMGATKSGKSTFLNKLTGRQEFKASEEFQAGTIGLHLSIWDTQLPTRSQDSPVVLFLDSEGLGHVAGNSVIDQKVAALLAALSDILVYNVRGNVFRHDLDYLSQAIQYDIVLRQKLAEHVQDQVARGVIVPAFEHFVILWQDCALSMDEVQVLQQLLSGIPDKHVKAHLTGYQKQNPSRLDIIVSGDSGLTDKAKTNETPLEDLSASYQRAVISMRKVVNQRKRVKYFNAENSILFTGEDFQKLLALYTKHANEINFGGIARSLVDKVVEQFKQVVEEKLSQLPLLEICKAIGRLAHDYSLVTTTVQYTKSETTQKLTSAFCPGATSYCEEVKDHGIFQVQALANQSLAQECTSSEAACQDFERMIFTKARLGVKFMSDEHYIRSFIQEMGGNVTTFCEVCTGRRCVSPKRACDDLKTQVDEVLQGIKVQILGGRLVEAVRLCFLAWLLARFTAFLFNTPFFIKISLTIGMLLCLCALATVIVCARLLPISTRMVLFGDLHEQLDSLSDGVVQGVYQAESILLKAHEYLLECQYVRP